jgi:hypothetical protein
VENPAPLVQALAAFPWTVVHSDWKMGNLGVIPGRPPRVVLLDWAVVGPAPPAVDLAWYLAVNSARLPVPKEAAIASYRGALERHLGLPVLDDWWQPQLDLCLLGGFLLLGWSKALGAAHGGTEEVRRREQAELDWWCARVRPALDRL